MSQYKKDGAQFDLAFCFEEGKSYLLEGRKKTPLIQAVAILKKGDHFFRTGSLDPLEPSINMSHERLLIFAWLSDVQRKSLVVATQDFKFSVNKKVPLTSDDWLFVSAILPNRGAIILTAGGNTLAFPSGISVLTASGLELIQTASNVCGMLTRPENDFNLLEDLCTKEEEEEDEYEYDDEEDDDREEVTDNDFKKYF